jgi:hypothetical protein
MLGILTSSFNISISGPESKGMIPVEVVLGSPELADQLSKAAENGQLGSGVQLAPMIPSTKPDEFPSAIVGGAVAGGIVGVALVIFIVKKVTFSHAGRTAKDNYVSMNSDVDTQLLG